jgi:putative ABC transport system ATP-binding protein/lipoprotein-releasing system ATP-binding protein
MPHDELVRGTGLRKVHGHGHGAVAALADATFTICEGDRIALVGPSGSGKSTLLHLIGGLDVPTGGAIKWPGIGPVTSLRPGPVSMAFQGPSLLPPLTVLENVALPVLLAGGIEADAAAAGREMLLRFGVGDVAEKLPEEISGGQSQRAGLARALAARPHLLLADEPTGQLDRETALSVVTALLDTLEETGAAIVVATHDRSVADLFPIRWSIAGGALTTAVSACSA